VSAPTHLGGVDSVMGMGGDPSTIRLGVDGGGSHSVVA
jgi:hypothetical protein